MNRNTERNRRLVIAAMLGAITVVLSLTPLGLIPLGVINATTMHIPVIIGAIAEGPVVGAMVGLIFGVSSLLNAILRNASPVAFVFYNPLISVLPRVLIGITSYYSYAAMKKIKNGASTLNITFVVILLALCIGFLVYSFKSSEKDFPIAIGAFVGSMTNTILVLGGIYVIYAKRYVEALDIPLENAKSAILGVSVTSGIPEAILSVIITTAVIKALKSRRG